MKKIILIYGALAGLIVSFMLFTTFSTSISTSENGELIGYASIVIAFATIFVAVKKHRDNDQDGQIAFWKAFKIGLGITLVASFIYVFAWMIMSETVAKDFMDDYYEQSLVALKSSGLSEAELDIKLEEAAYFKELYKNPFFKIGITFSEIFPVGLIFSLLSAVILKKKASSMA